MASQREVIFSSGVANCWCLLQGHFQMSLLTETKNGGLAKCCKCHPRWLWLLISVLSQDSNQFLGEFQIHCFHVFTKLNRKMPCKKSYICFILRANLEAQKAGLKLHIFGLNVTPQLSYVVSRTGLNICNKYYMPQLKSSCIVSQAKQITWNQETDNLPSILPIPWSYKKYKNN